MKRMPMRTAIRICELDSEVSIWPAREQFEALRDALRRRSDVFQVLVMPEEYTVSQTVSVINDALEEVQTTRLWFSIVEIDTSNDLPYLFIVVGTTSDFM